MYIISSRIDAAYQAILNPIVYNEIIIHNIMIIYIFQKYFCTLKNLNRDLKNKNVRNK